MYTPVKYANFVIKMTQASELCNISIRQRTLSGLLGRKFTGARRPTCLATSGTTMADLPRATMLRGILVGFVKMLTLMLFDLNVYEKSKCD